MAFAVTHILSTILLLDIWRNKIYKHKKKIPLAYIYFAGFFSMMPDLDFIVYHITNQLFGWNLVHRIHSHTILMPMVIMVFASFMFNINKKWGRITVLCAFAYLGHIILDYLVGWPPFTYLWPFSSAELTFTLLPKAFKDWFWWAALDAALLIVWLFWEFKHNRIKDFM